MPLPNPGSASAPTSADETRSFAIAIVLDHEGGLSVDPRDPGNYPSGVVGRGPLAGTKYGISAASFPHLNINNLTREQAADIYISRYWNAIRADELPPALAIIMFDAAVNSGVPAAIRFLQKTVGSTADGWIGPNTLAATHAYPGSVADLCAGFTGQRALAIAGDRNFAVYGLGWSTRVAKVLLAAAKFLDQE